MNASSATALRCAPPSYEQAMRASNRTHTGNSACVTRIDYGEDLLMTACRNNDLDTLGSSQRLRLGINDLYECKKTDCLFFSIAIGLLHLACLENKPQVVKLLLELGADPNFKLPRTNITPMQLVCCSAGVHPEIAGMLANYLFPQRLDVDANHCFALNGRRFQCTLLQLACWSQNVDAVKALLLHNAKPDKLAAPGWQTPPLHLACGNKKGVNAEIIKCLLKAHANANTFHDGSTPLHLLCTNDKTSEQALLNLLRCGAMINAVGPGGVSALMLSVERNARLTDIILNRPFICVTAADAQGWQALHYAAKSGHLTTIAALINRGADVNAKTIKGLTPLHLAVLSRNEMAINILLDHGADSAAKAIVNPFSRSEACTFSLSLFCSVLCCPVASVLLPEHCDCRKPIPAHQRNVTRCGQLCCPTRCALTPLELAEEELRERMSNRVVSIQPGLLS